MKSRRKLYHSFLSLFLSLTLILGCFSSVGQAKVSLSSNIPDNPKQYLDKIDSAVKAELSDAKKEVEVLVYLRDRVDSKMVSLSNAIGKTKVEKELSSRKAVISALREKSESTQAEILKYLLKKKSLGKASDIKPFYIANIIYVKTTEDVINELAARSDVEMVYLNKTIEIEKPIISSNTVQNAPQDEIEWNIKQVGAPNVWNKYGIDGTGVVVGIIDTGVSWEHPALKNKWRGFDPVTQTVVNPEDSWYDPIGKKTLPYDVEAIPHGTHVTGTVLGQEADGKNTIGVAPGARWIAAKAFTEKGGQHVDILAAAEWMLNPNGKAELAPDIVNNSWGGSTNTDPWFVDIENAWRAANILPVFAAGNQKPGEPLPVPGSIQNPSSLPGSFAVAAVDINNKRGSFSKLGPSLWDPNIIKPDISAPGVNIRSSVPTGYEAGWNGTSMASPHVAGVAALMKSANYSLTIAQIETILKNTAIKLTDATYPVSPNMGYGYGLVNAFDAVSEVLGIGNGTIQGQVMIPGEDTIDPEIIHSASGDVYQNQSVTINANFKDNVAITEAKLYFKNDSMTDWQEINMTLKEGNAKDGYYEAIIPGSLVIKPGFDYKLIAKDYGNNVIETQVYRVNILFGLIPDKYFNDLETDTLGWELSGEWTWFTPSYILAPKPYSGTKVFAVVDAENKKNPSANTTNTLITPSLDLRDTKMKSASLRFYQWYDIYYDMQAQILISTDDGATFNVISTLTGKQDSWKEMSIDLTPYIGNPSPVKVAFKLTVNQFTGAALGWYIDNIKFIGDDFTPPAIPTDISTTGKMNGISIKWSASPDGDLSKYNVYRSETPNEGYTLIGSSTETNYLDLTAQKETSYYYVVTAVDLAGNESEYSSEASGKVAKMSVIYYSNFEDDNGGFTTGVIGTSKNDWAWGVPSSGPMAALTGTKVWATNLAGVYQNNQKSYIDSPSITIPADIVSPVLSFDSWWDTEKGTFSLYDWINVQISVDNGANWKVIKDKFGGSNRKWETTQIGLDEYKGKTVKIRFYLEADMVTGKEGWYIDSVSVYGQPTSTGSVKINNVQNSNTILQDIAKGLPADAVVTILETGRSVKTDIATGNFVMPHAATQEGKTWTLRATAYGYYPKEIKVNLKSNETITQLIMLEAIKKGTITGTVIDKDSKKPVANATVRVLEDSNILSVTTDSEGKFTIDGVYAGNYTLRVVSQEFCTENIAITVLGDQDNKIDVSMKKYSGTLNEIAYDDGASDLSRAFVNAGTGFGVRFTPSGFGRLKAARIYFTDNHAKALGNKIGIGVVTVDDKGKINIIGAIKEITINRGEWNEISLLDYDINTDKDFYIVTQQLYPIENSPAIGIDANSSEKDRSYVYTGGLTPIAEYSIDGGMMIRAVMEYPNAPTTPEITNLNETNYTNKGSISLEGNMSIDGKVTILVNGVEVTSVDTKDTLFKADLQLTDEVNTITVYGEVAGIKSELSKPITVIVDKLAPELNLVWPNSNLINKFTVEVSGNVKDKNFKKLLINGNEVTVDENGDFTISLPVVEGENTITVSAYDLADNVTTATKNVNVAIIHPTAPEVTNLNEINYTSKDSITLEGKMNIDGKVTILVNGIEISSVFTKDRLFSLSLDLKDKVNTITIYGEADGMKSELSKPITVIVDKLAPELNLVWPKGDLTNKNSVVISGNVKDNNFKKLLINGNEVMVDKDGNFSVSIPVIIGENTITVSAYDFADNVTTVEKKVVIASSTKLPKTGASNDILLMLLGGFSFLSAGYWLLRKRQFRK